MSFYKMLKMLSMHVQKEDYLECKGEKFNEIHFRWIKISFEPYVDVIVH